MKPTWAVSWPVPSLSCPIASLLERAWGCSMGALRQGWAHTPQLLLQVKGGTIGNWSWRCAQEPFGEIWLHPEVKWTRLPEVTTLRNSHRESRRYWKLCKGLWQTYVWAERPCIRLKTFKVAGEDPSCELLFLGKGKPRWELEELICLPFTVHCYPRWLCAVFGKPPPKPKLSVSSLVLPVSNARKNQGAKCLWTEFLVGDATPCRSCEEFLGWQQSWWPLTHFFTSYLACETASGWEEQLGRAGVTSSLCYSSPGLGLWLLVDVRHAAFLAQIL